MLMLNKTTVGTNQMNHNNQFVIAVLLLAIIGLVKCRKHKNYSSSSDSLASRWGESEPRIQLSLIIKNKNPLAELVIAGRIMLYFFICY